MYVCLPFMRAVFLVVGIYCQSMLAMSEAMKHVLAERRAQDIEVVQTHQDIALSFDVDDVISGKLKAGVSDYLPMVARLVFWHPMVTTALFPSNQTAVTNYAAELQKTVNGGTNIIHAVIGYLKEQGYGDLSSYETEMVEISQKPYPVMPMIEHVRKLRAEGRPVVAATNQDYIQHQAYRRYMLANHNIDLNKLFDAVLTTCVYHDVTQPAGDDSFYRLNATDNIYVTRKHEDYKPHESYFKVLEQMVEKIAPTTTQIIHTDDKKENVDAADKVGIKGIFFDLKADSVRKATPEQLKQAISTWENDLKAVMGARAQAVTA